MSVNHVVLHPRIREPSTMDGPRRLESTATIRGHEKTLFFQYFVYFVVPTLGRPQAPRMAPMHPKNGSGCGDPSDPQVEPNAWPML